MDTTKDQLPIGISPTQGSNRLILITAVIGLVLIAAVWIWKSIEISSLKKQADTEKQVLVKQAQGQILEAHSQQLKLLAKPFVWALRTEMMEGNLNQVNLYMSDMVKEPNIQQIVIANAKGIVIASTNKKDEGQSFSLVAKGADANADQTKIDTAGKVLTMTSPVMGFNNRLGTLYLRYAIPDANLK